MTSPSTLRRAGLAAALAGLCVSALPAGAALRTAAPGRYTGPTVVDPLVAASRAVPKGFLTRAGSRLVLDSKAFRFTGVNAYSLATVWGRNAGCGPAATDAQLDALFAGLRPNSLVRIWAYQGSMTTNVVTGARDWTALDRVVAAAARRGQKLILSITGQGEGCDDGRWKDLTWYAGGYRTALNLDPRTRITASYWDYTREIVTRYKSSPVVGMWELVGEPEVSVASTHACLDHDQAAGVLREFFDTVGGEVKRIDPHHLIHSGVIGSGQCGSSGEHYTYVHESPALDVASYHDYGADSVPVPGDQWNGLQVRLDAMKRIDKPLVVSEVGVRAQRSLAGCATLDQRTTLLRNKANAQLAAGAAGFMPWNWMPTNDGSCSYETITTGDPVLSMLKAVAL
jgi:hypothetical protein